MPTVNIDTQTGEFLTDGSLFDGVRYTRMTVPINPDPRIHKWNGIQVVAKTATETASFDAAVAKARGVIAVSIGMHRLIQSLVEELPAILGEFTNTGTLNTAQAVNRIEARVARKAIG